ncbi:conserved Plasmodium protein, unknown function [Plasmodium sp. gorilla clade G2]|uniref:conserved Plasmodium protein, unknown function n=1 Tax=Plasmodium sp. gorilla clade G2 TaxID=880535 RepID=UPI000D203CB2|nr:conserved Plasmodium protein, unknown function [Plasmodium sp. gorilla clade G2]SOV18491.1 conserved Plasmodium protein, unknown function [Plasmodium sp. gorilla clade G2]
MNEESEIRNVPFFIFRDIKKKRMRKIILMCNKKKQKKMLLKSLNIKFIYEEENKKNVNIHIDNFLPLSINRNMSIKKNNKDIIYDDNSCNLYDINKLKIEKMKKIIKDFFYDIFLFCVNKNLSIKEISTFLSIKKYIFYKYIFKCENIINLFLQYKQIMLSHCINRIPNSIKVFSFSSLHILLKYSVRNFFKNYAFYKYIFTPHYKISFQCIHKNFNYLEIANRDSLQICSDDVATCQEIKILESQEYLKGLLTSRVGFMDDYHDKSSVDNFLEIFQTHLNMYDIKKDCEQFEINKYEQRRDIEKAFSLIKNNILHKYDEKKKEEKKKDKDKLIRRVQNMYDDVENKIMSSLKKILDITNNDEEQEKC